MTITLPYVSLKQPMRIYIESTIPSYVVARPARDLFQVVRQELTRNWWESQRPNHDCFVSYVVWKEISAGNPEMARLRRDLLAWVTICGSDPDAEALARDILDSGVLPSSADGDAAHI